MYHAIYLPEHMKQAKQTPKIRTCAESECNTDISHRGVAARRCVSCQYKRHLRYCAEYRKRPEVKERKRLQKVNNKEKYEAFLRGLREKDLAKKLAVPRFCVVCKTDIRKRTRRSIRCEGCQKQYRLDISRDNAAALSEKRRKAALKRICATATCGVSIADRGATAKWCIECASERDVQRRTAVTPTSANK